MEADSSYVYPGGYPLPSSSSRRQCPRRFRIRCLFLLCNLPHWHTAGALWYGIRIHAVIVAQKPMRVTTRRRAKMGSLYLFRNCSSSLRLVTSTF